MTLFVLDDCVSKHSLPRVNRVCQAQSDIFAAAAAAVAAAAAQSSERSRHCFNVLTLAKMESTLDDIKLVDRKNDGLFGCEGVCVWNIRVSANFRRRYVA